MEGAQGSVKWDYGRSPSYLRTNFNGKFADVRPRQFENVGLAQACHYGEAHRGHDLQTGMFR